MGEFFSRISIFIFYKNDILSKQHRYIRIVQHTIPSLNSSDEECLADFEIRQKVRITYPGACSLEYESIMQILVEDLVQWDMKKQKAKRPGVVGTVEAFGPADEEQGRGTLHSHWQIWIKQLRWEVREQLFQSDPHKKKTATTKFAELIDKVMSSSLGADLDVIHKCQKTKKSSSTILPIPKSTCIVDDTETHEITDATKNKEPEKKYFEDRKPPSETFEWLLFFFHLHSILVWLILNN